MHDPGDTPLAMAANAALAGRGDLSGVYPLHIAQEAFAARAMLARSASRTLDVQYYIWHADTTGWLMLGELWNAAERGVRVRLLLDDNGIAGLDPALAALDSHRNIEVRLFNPFAQRRFKALGYLTEFRRLNRRMHNKSFTADTAVTIVGGRNIGDAYFGAGTTTMFADLDVLALGPIASDTEAEFERYWQAAAVRPAAEVIGKARPDGVAALAARFAFTNASDEAVAYLATVRTTRLVEALLALELPLEWARVRLVCDPPDKAKGGVPEADLLIASLREALGTPEREIDLVSPYFVPGGQGTVALARYAERGVTLRIVTNSLAATDVSAVHAGYAKRRERLLRAGVRIYETRLDAEQLEDEGRERHGAGSSSASLHAKTFSIDRGRVFIGSFNLDPRSIHLNTEMGIVIESPTLAASIAKRIDRAMEHWAYEVVLAPNGRGLEWVERGVGGEVRYRTDPKTSFTKRLAVAVLALLPIEWLL